MAIVILALFAACDLDNEIEGALNIGGIFDSAIEKEEMELIFNKDYELLVIVLNYLASSNHAEIYIHSTMESGELSARGHRIDIEDVEVIDAIDALMRRGYSVIGREENTIHFQRWASRHAGRGVAYSIDGSEPSLFFLTKLEPLSVPNWYYYEEDFNEWRRRNPS